MFLAKHLAWLDSFKVKHSCNICSMRDYVKWTSHQSIGFIFVVSQEKVHRTAIKYLESAPFQWDNHERSAGQHTHCGSSWPYHGMLKDGSFHCFTVWKQLIYNKIQPAAVFKLFITTCSYLQRGFNFNFMPCGCSANTGKDFCLWRMTSAKWMIVSMQSYVQTRKSSSCWFEYHYICQECLIILIILMFSP